jgi:hypothetical protein
MNPFMIFYVKNCFEKLKGNRVLNENYLKFSRFKTYKI